jgi:hypothetical protein
VVRLAQGCPLLSWVALTDTAVGDAGVIALATYCTNLTRLFLCGCSNITLRGLQSLADHCTRLQGLVLPVRFLSYEEGCSCLDAAATLQRLRTAPK